MVYDAVAFWIVFFINNFQFFSHCLTKKWKTAFGYSVYVCCFHFVVFTHVFSSSLQARGVEFLLLLSIFSRMSYKQGHTKAVTFCQGSLHSYISHYQLMSDVCTHHLHKNKQVAHNLLIFLSILIPISTHRNGFITIAEEFPNDG